jgi:hypothetical protein
MLMMLLALILAIDAILHAILVFRFGTNENMPFLVFAIIDIILAIIVYLLVPYAVWATLILSAIGLIGLTVTFNKPQREKTLDRIIWVVDAVVVLYSIYLLFVQ